MTEELQELGFEVGHHRIGRLMRESGNGNYYDNVVVETFFKTLKAELIWRNTWQTRR